MISFRVLFIFCSLLIVPVVAMEREAEEEQFEGAQPVVEVRKEIGAPQKRQIQVEEEGENGTGSSSGTQIPEEEDVTIEVTGPNGESEPFPMKREVAKVSKIIRDQLADLNSEENITLEVPSIDLFNKYKELAELIVANKGKSEKDIVAAIEEKIKDFDLTIDSLMLLGKLGDKLSVDEILKACVNILSEYMAKEPDKIEILKKLLKDDATITQYVFEKSPAYRYLQMEKAKNQFTHFTVAEGTESISWSPGKKIAVGIDNKLINLIDPETGLVESRDMSTLVKDIVKVPSGEIGVAWGAEGTVLAVSWGKSVYCFDEEVEKILNKFSIEEGKNEIRSIKWSPDGMSIAALVHSRESRSGDIISSPIYVWKYEEKQGEQEKEKNKPERIDVGGYVPDFAWSADSKKIFYIKRRVDLLVCYRSPQHKKYYIPFGNQKFYTYYLDNHKTTEGTVTGLPSDSTIVSIAGNPKNNDEFAVIEEGRRGVIWQIEKNREKFEFEIPDTDTLPFFSIAWSPDGTMLCATSPDKIVLFDTQTNNPMRRIRIQGRGCRVPVVFNPNNTAIAYTFDKPKNKMVIKALVLSALDDRNLYPEASVDNLDQLSVITAYYQSEDNRNFWQSNPLLLQAAQKLPPEAQKFLHVPANVAVNTPVSWKSYFWQKVSSWFGSPKRAAGTTAVVGGLAAAAYLYKTGKLRPIVDRAQEAIRTFKGAIKYPVGK